MPYVFVRENKIKWWVTVQGLNYNEVRRGVTVQGLNYNEVRGCHSPQFRGSIITT